MSSLLLPIYELPTAGPILLTVVMHGERPKSTNSFWSGMSHHERTKYKNMCRAVVREALPDAIQMGENPMFPYSWGRVDIREIYYYKGNGQDPDNLCLKGHIDGMTGEHGQPCAVIEDDSNEFVRWVCKRTERDKDNPRVEIQFHVAFESEAQVLQWHDHWAMTGKEVATLGDEQIGLFGDEEVNVDAPLAKMEWKNDGKV